MTISNKTTSSFAWLAALALPLALTGCPSDDTPSTTEATETGTDTTGDGDGDGDTATGDGDGDGDSATGDGDGDGDTMGDPCMDAPGSVGCPCADSSTCDDGLLCLDSDVCEADPFDTSGPYTRVDRMGMPGVNTALIVSKDAYNAADPANDLAMDFVDEIVDSVQALHAALDDDLANNGLVPCSLLDCVGVGGPLVIPDTLKVDYDDPAGFPNGRALADPVMDVVLAVLLLDLGEPGQDPGTLAGLPLNPPANDVAFDDAFPYLAAPN